MEVGVLFGRWNGGMEEEMWILEISNLP